MKKLVAFQLCIGILFLGVLQAQSLSNSNAYQKFLKLRDKYKKYLKVAPNLVASKNALNNGKKDYFKTQNQLYALDSIVSDSTKIQYLYDIDGFVTDMIIYQLGTNGDWVEDIKEEYVYDAQTDDLAEIIIYEYDDILFTWEKYLKLEIVYNASNLIDGENLYVWYSNSWLKVMYSEITYNLNNTIAEEEWFELNFMNMQFEESFKVEYDYNANQDLDYLTYYYFDDVTNSYQESHRFDYYYNFSQKLSMIIQQNYDDINFTWEDTLKTVFSYDIQNVLESEEQFYWDDISNSWEEVRKFYYVYDINYDNSDLLLPKANFYSSETGSTLNQDYIIIFEELYYPYMLETVTEYEFDDNQNNYALVDEHDYYYSLTTITSKSQKSLSSNTPVLYPNPVKDMIYVQGITEGTITIFNAQGQTVYEGTIKSNINVGFLPTGLYTYQLQSQNQIFTGKIVKE